MTEQPPDYTISFVRGEQPGVNGVEFDNPNEDSPIFLGDLPKKAQLWIRNNAHLTEEHEDAWCLVTADDVQDAYNVLATYHT